MRTFFLFYLLSSLLHNPLLALLLVAVVAYFLNARLSGRYFNPARIYNRYSAVQELRRTLRLNDNDVGAHNDLGRILADQGKYEDALPHMVKAIERMGESAETNYYLGLCRLMTGDCERGISDIRRSLEINPGFLYGQPFVTLARHYRANDINDEALEAASQAVKINTSSVEGWLIAGEAHEASGDTAAARESYRAAGEAYEHLPRYLRLANRGFARQARRALRRLG
ncbi:MAG: tetratricopeptide repeat protein [Candidatus Binatia bacterium]